MGITITNQYFTGFLIVFFCIFTVTGQAHARKVKELTDENVRAFIEKSTEYTNGQAEQDSKTILKFLEKHLHKDARFKTSLKYILPGFPPQESALVMEKNDFIEKVEEGVDAFEKHESEIVIESVEVTSSKKQALVKTEGKEAGVMVVPTPKGEQRVSVEGFTKCNQIIRLNRKGVIQLYNAVCDTIIEFTGSPP